MGDMLEPAVALAMPGHVERGALAHGQGRRTPHLPALLVTDIQRLARRIADWVIRPGGQLVLAAIDAPCVPASRL